MDTEDKKYLVQEGIDCIEYENKQCHIRAMTLRGKDGELIKPLLLAKIGGNTSLGGTMDDVGKMTSILVKRFSLPKRALIERIDSFANALHEELEKSIGAEIGDLGHDIVFDQLGELWAIESNTKSGQIVAVDESGICCDEKHFDCRSWIVFGLDLQAQRDRAIAQYAKHLHQKNVSP